MRGIEGSAARAAVPRGLPGALVAFALLVVPAGASALQLTGVRAVVPAVTGQPVVTSLSPSQGTALGGNKVTIRGEHLKGVTTVSFGPAAVALPTVSRSETKIKVVAPAGAGTVDVLVSTPEATSEVVPADVYTYTPAVPIVTKLGPKIGPAHEQETVKIKGQNLTGATEVRFGETAVPFTVLKPTQIAAKAPLEQVARTVDVTVTTPQGTSTTSSADHYTFEKQLPSIEDLEPLSGFVGQTVTVSGEGYLGASAVHVGGVPATHFEVISDDELKLVVPPHVAESVAIGITTPFGTGPEACFGPKCTPGAHFKIFPLITSLSPGSGPQAGGTLVSFEGSGFSTVEDRVYFGEKQVVVKCESTSVCKVLSPEAKKGPGTVPVEVHVPTNYAAEESHSPVTEATQFTYE